MGVTDLLPRFTVAYALFEIQAAGWGFDGRQGAVRVVPSGRSLPRPPAAWNLASLMGHQFLFGAGDSGRISTWTGVHHWGLPGARRTGRSASCGCATLRWAAPLTGDAGRVGDLPCGLAVGVHGVRRPASVWAVIFYVVGSGEAPRTIRVNAANSELAERSAAHSGRHPPRWPWARICARAPCGC